jgi:hypothetical protein
MLKLWLIWRSLRSEFHSDLIDKKAEVSRELQDSTKFLTGLSQKGARGMFILFSR